MVSRILRILLMVALTGCSVWQFWVSNIGNGIFLILLALIVLFTYFKNEWMIMALLAMTMKEKGRLDGDTAVVTVMSNLGFIKYMESQGINTEKTAVGDRYVLENMRENGFSIGGEQSGHVILLHHATTGDGELSGVQLLKTVVKSGKKLSQLAKIMTVYPQVLINVQVTPEGKQKYNNDEYIISAVQQAEMDLMGDGRVLVRVSGTEPLVRVMLEGKDLEKITRLGNRIADVVRERLS